MRAEQARHPRPSLFHHSTTFCEGRKMPGGRPRTRTEPDAVKSVGKVLDILEHLGQARGPVSVSDVARDTGLNVSTAFRQLQTLVSRGFVEQDAAHRGYEMGPRLYQ